MLVSILQQSDDFGPLIHVLRRLRVARDEFERIGWYWRLGKFLESSARQPELTNMLQIKMFIVAGLLDAVPIIGVAVGFLLLYSNPFLAALGAK